MHYSICRNLKRLDKRDAQVLLVTRCTGEQYNTIEGICVPCFEEAKEKQEKHRLRQRKVTEYFPRQRVSSGPVEITANVG